VGLAQRLAMQIAEKPLELREAAFGLAERSLCECVKERVAGDQIDRLIERQMSLVRWFDPSVRY